MVLKEFWSLHTCFAFDVGGEGSSYLSSGRLGVEIHLGRLDLKMNPMLVCVCSELYYRIMFHFYCENYPGFIFIHWDLRPNL